MMNMTPYYTHTLRTRNNAPVRYVSPFSDEFMRSFFGDNAATTMKVDVEDLGDRYLLQTDLPGIKKDDVKLSVEDGVLTIAVEQKSEQNENEPARNYVYHERRSVSMSRSFSLEGVDEEHISAEYVDGVLHLTLPKKTEPEEKVRRIEIK